MLDGKEIIFKEIIRLVDQRGRVLSKKEGLVVNPMNHKTTPEDRKIQELNSALED